MNSIRDTWQTTQQTTQNGNQEKQQDKQTNKQTSYIQQGTAFTTIKNKRKQSKAIGGI